MLTVFLRYAVSCDFAPPSEELLHISGSEAAVLVCTIVGLRKWAPPIWTSEVMASMTRTGLEAASDGPMGRLTFCLGKVGVVLTLARFAASLNQKARGRSCGQLHREWSESKVGAQGPQSQGSRLKAGEFEAAVGCGVKGFGSFGMLKGAPRQAPGQAPRQWGRSAAGLERIGNQKFLLSFRTHPDDFIWRNL